MGEILSYSDFIKTYKTRGYRLNHLEDYKKFFPIKSNKTLAGIIADLICDGSLQGEPKWRIDFTSKSINELKRFEKEIGGLFDIKGKIRKCTSNKYGETYNLGINSSPITRILFLCGVPPGQKVLTKFSMPKWIIEDKEYFRRFSQRLFSCEGGILNEENRKTPQIRLEMWKAESLIDNGHIFIKDICKNLERHFNIKSTITFPKKRNKRKDGIVTQPVRVYILGESVKKFYDEVGFEGDKQKALKALISK